tara:strand:- start:218 stop:538 length:321 start_codon:yes stop_codon:yes gene_type:complete
MSGMDPASINGGNNVLPPYASNTDPQSFLSTGTYNASQYGAAWTDPSGTALSCSGKLIGGGGGKGKKKPRFKMKSASRRKKSHKKSHSKKKRIQVKRSRRRKTHKR